MGSEGGLLGEGSAQGIHDFLPRSGCEKRARTSHSVPMGNEHHAVLTSREKGTNADRALGLSYDCALLPANARLLLLAIFAVETTPAFPGSRTLPSLPPGKATIAWLSASIASAVAFPAAMGSAPSLGGPGCSHHAILLPLGSIVLSASSRRVALRRKVAAMREFGGSLLASLKIS